MYNDFYDPIENAIINKYRFQFCFAALLKQTAVYNYLAPACIGLQK